MPLFIEEYFGHRQHVGWRYTICISVIGFASWNLNHYINGFSAYHVGGNSAKTLYFLIFSISAAVLGVTSKLAGGYSLRTWRKDSLSTATAASLVAWAVTALAFGLVCKEINIGGSRGWRLKVLERLVIVLTFTQFLYLSVINAGFYNSRYGPN
ncbi:Plasma membrane associated protein [Zostera marina]|uniref:Plasma membrane associated protein n=1 Tax=Zostera marina TaxID=29655 RepID=A0A0K9P178_ZOSMR|nr:Plasma membrane associated protein [Zostera marina]